MRIKILAGVAAAAIAVSSVAITPAQARWHHWHHGGWGAPLAGFAAGAIVGGALAAAPPYYDDYGPYYYDGPAYAYEPGGSVAYCEEHFKSYNPETGLYVGYDGRHHPCP
jgi:BA14K-like protein